MRLRTALLLASGLISVTPAAHPQSPSKAPAATQPTPTLKVYSREIVVDVTVTDDHGNPVHGLTAHDFTLKENGHPQPLRSFHEFGLAQTSATPPPPPLPPGVFTNFQAVPATGPVQIFLIDTLNNPTLPDPGSMALGSSPGFASMGFQQQSILQFLARSRPGPQIAIYWLSDSGLHLLQGFTSDRNLLAGAIRSPLIDVEEPLDPWFTDWTTLDALRQIALYAAPVHGRKNLLWFTRGMPVMLTHEGGYGWSDGSSATMPFGGGASDSSFGHDMTLVHRFMDVFDLFTTEQVAVYPIDPSFRPHVGRGTLRAEAVAEATGGLALSNRNDLATSISTAIVHGSEFYAISYVPPGKMDDGHYHTISVQLDRPGLHLAYRRGYNAETVRDRAPIMGPVKGPALIKASMEGKAPPATGILFDARVTRSLNPAPTGAHAAIAKPGPLGIPETSGSADIPAEPNPVSTHASIGPAVGHYTIQYFIPHSQLAVHTQPDGSATGALEFDAAAYDRTGHRVALLSQTLRLHLTAAELPAFQSHPFLYTQVLDLPPGQNTLRVGVLDTTSDKAGTIEIPVLTHAVATDDAPPPPCPPRCPVATPTAAKPSR